MKLLIKQLLYDISGLDNVFYIWEQYLTIWINKQSEEQ